MLPYMLLHILAYLLTYYMGWLYGFMHMVDIWDIWDGFIHMVNIWWTYGIYCIPDYLVQPSVNALMHIYLLTYLLIKWDGFTALCICWTYGIYGMASYIWWIYGI